LKAFEEVRLLKRLTQVYEMANIIFSNHAKEMMGQRRIGERDI